MCHIHFGLDCLACATFTLALTVLHVPHSLGSGVGGEARDQGFRRTLRPLLTPQSIKFERFLKLICVETSHF
jgi:hypothetical protein